MAKRQMATRTKYYSEQAMYRAVLLGCFGGGTVAIIGMLIGLTVLE
tara:strand:- start:1038 stop:1175 length:138 start_codon:yes stop_codon:yes gene_type:complete